MNSYLSGSQSNQIEEDFVELDRGGFCGILRRGHDDTLVSRIIQQGAKRGHGYGWALNNGVYAKKLRTDEMREIPAIRFLNALTMWRRGSFHGAVPMPIGLVYEGKGSDFAAGRLRGGYYLAENIVGDRLFEKIAGLDAEDIELLMAHLKIGLEDFASKGIYPLDFAPRDIVLRHGYIYSPVLVDTEHLEVFGNQIPLKEKPELRALQRKQFFEDYEHFLGSERTKSYAGFLFEDRDID